MQIELSRLASMQYILPPFRLVDWVGWFVLFAVVAYGAWNWRKFPPLVLNTWLLLAALLIAAPAASLFFGIQIPGEASFPQPNMPIERSMPYVMVFGAVPWVLAAGMLGSLPALGIGLASGLALSLTQTHTLFMPLVIGGLALLFSAAVRQRYRSRFFQFLRHPFGAAALLAVAYAPVFMLSGFFEVSGTLAVRLDYAITQTWPVVLARGIELLIAGGLAELLMVFKAAYWPRPALLIPSPAETSLQMRIFSTFLPLGLVLIFSLIIADWLIAGTAARRMVRDRLASTAQVASDSLPYFMEAGQNLLQNMATPDLLDLSPADLSITMGDRLRSVPYFRQLFLFDARGAPISGYPALQLAQLQPTDEEMQGIALALKGVPVQTYIVPPVKDEPTAQVSFIAVIQDSFGQNRGVLLGRTDLNSNPFTQPAIQALQTMRQMGGDGIILDENRMMLYNSSPNLVMTVYNGDLPAGTNFFDDDSSQGTRLLAYLQPVPGREWQILLTVPAEQAQELALTNALPLLLILLAAAIGVGIMMRISLSGVTSSIRELSQEAVRISAGELNHSFNVRGEDEVGRLGAAFEKMRLSLKARLDELNRLLLISQGVASSLDVKDTVRPILEAALSGGASSARVVMLKDVSLDPQHSDRLTAFGMGAAAGTYAYLDEQIFEMARHQELISIANTARVRRISFPAGKPHPAALMARALYHENTYYGVLWVGYEQTHAFMDEEMRFFTTLSGQAALSAANARLYASAEVGRQRLEAVLASTPEPVLVIDANGCLLLLNPAALQAPGLVASSIPGKPIKEVVGMPVLLEMLTAPASDRLATQEITLPGGRVYFVNVSPVIAEGLPVGKICILQDITHYKELDALKSEFVATVSHDLRSPLTLMRGYSTMLQMVGELNDQQKGYTRKINESVENMTRLVNNLLDLGRIEAGIDLQLEEVSTADVVDQVIGSLQPQAAQKNITLTRDIAAVGSYTIEADKALIQQAVVNLVENAIKYTGVDGKVKVKLQSMPDGILLEVQDNGIGIAPLDLPHLFEKFFRSGRREAYQQRGTGLGLAIVKSIAERHSGKVWVDSTLGKGSVFYLELPTRPQTQGAK